MGEWGGGGVPHRVRCLRESRPVMHSETRNSLCINTVRTAYSGYIVPASFSCIAVLTVDRMQGDPGDEQPRI